MEAKDEEKTKQKKTMLKSNSNSTPMLTNIYPYNIEVKESIEQIVTERLRSKYIRSMRSEHVVQDNI